MISKINLIAGDNISIVGNTISASGYAVGVVETRASALTKILDRNASTI